MIKQILSFFCLCIPVYGAAAAETVPVPETRSLETYFTVDRVDYSTFPEAVAPDFRPTIERIAMVPDSHLKMTTTEIGFVGNLSSSSEIPVGGIFIKTQRIWANGISHDLCFSFTRLERGADRDNLIQYATVITVDGGTVRRNDVEGAIIGDDTPMILTFNERGELNLFDYKQATEADLPPPLYITWKDPIALKWDIGRGKGFSPTRWAGTADLDAEGKFYAYDGPSRIMEIQQTTQCLLCFTKTEQTRFSRH